MTTIVYDHEARQIAVDGRATEGDLIATDSYKKWQIVGNDIYFLCGATSDHQRLIDYHTGVLSGKLEYSIECVALIASNGKCFNCGVTDEGEAFRSPIDYSFAVGTGRRHALTAIDLGSGALKAVQMAAKRDVGTGGVITVFDLESMKFIERPSE